MTGLLPSDFEWHADRETGHAVLFAHEENRGEAASGNAPAGGKFRAESDVHKSFEIARKGPADNRTDEAR